MTKHFSGNVDSFLHSEEGLFGAAMGHAHHYFIE
jgi:hypothetical protein